MNDRTHLQQAFGGAEAQVRTLSTTKMPGSPINRLKRPLPRAKADLHLAEVDAADGPARSEHVAVAHCRGAS
jgi:hypothetical protein